MKIDCRRPLSLFTKIKRLNKKVAQLKSTRNDKELERYLQSAFEIPIQESSLVGKMIQHRVREEGDDDVFWECGEVIHVEKPNKNVKRTL